MKPEPSPKGKRRWRVSRRGFLIGLGTAGAGVALGWRYGLPELRLRAARWLDGAGAPGGVDAPPQAWLELEPDETVTLYLPKVEMGQGIHTALAQIAAEELDIPWERMRVASAPTTRGIADPFGTGGSSSVNALYTPLREAAWTLREMLRGAAAARWGVPLEDAVAMDGRVFRRDAPDVSLGYGEIAAQTTTWPEPDGSPALKDRREFRYIGRSLPRVDGLAKLTGRAVYGYDARLPGMLYGAVARPPRPGATLARAGVGSTEAHPGVVRVVLEEGFAGVVATNRKAARDAVEKLELSWEGGSAANQAELEALVTAQPGRGVVIQREGRAAAQLREGNVLEAEYRTPFAAHAHLEPQAALVDVRPEGVTALVSTQSPTAVARELSGLLSRPEAEVDLTATYLGGGFGRRLNVEVASEAARLSRAAGRPVHVGWTREEEFRHGYVRPATHSVLRARLDASGNIVAFVHVQASGDVACPFFPAVAATLLGADFGAWRGATCPYGAVPHRLTRAERVELPVRTGWWRGLGLLANTFARESFMDELAHAAGADPLDFRLRHLTPEGDDARLARVLEVAAERAGWGRALPEGRGLGVACSTDVRTVVAHVAEVSVAGGRIQVHRVTAAVDPGLVVNPDGAKAQTEGNIVMGLSSTLVEEVTFQDGMPEASNFDRYPLLTLRDAPDIEVALLESGDEPFGMGEPPMGPIAAAVANAVFAATGERLRRLPLRPS